MQERFAAIIRNRLKQVAAQNDNLDMKARFATLSEKLARNEARVNDDPSAAQGRPADLGGYFMPLPEHRIEHPAQDGPAGIPFHRSAFSSFNPFENFIPP